MASKRPLIIPRKRPLLPPHTSSDKSAKSQPPRVLNPSAVAAETRMKKAAPRHYSSDSADESLGEDSEDEKPGPVKFAFAAPPQPFLEPPTWEGMLKRHAQAQTRGVDGSGDTRDKSRDAGGRGEEGLETADERVRRREREAEYGSMAVRGRSRVGRGKREKGRKLRG
ncbi:hypothetical protein N7470_000907 [Penicillium chermesinum]|nr:hypothetical protein N7470_000907 [Penicillium chermesinum]